MNEDQVTYARSLADWAESNPPGFDQNTWLTIEGPPEHALMEAEGIPITLMREGSCRTSACLAGRAVIDHAPEGTIVVEGETLLIPGQDPVNLSDWAAMDLGLSYEQALAIFYAPAKEAIAKLRYVADHRHAIAREVEQAIPSRYVVPADWIEEGSFSALDMN